MSAQSYGCILRQLRTTRKKSLTEIAKLAGLDISYLSRIETGARSVPAESIRTSIARALELSQEETRLLEESNHSRTLREKVVQQEGEVMVMVMNVKDAKKLIRYDHRRRAALWVQYLEAEESM